MYVSFRTTAALNRRWVGRERSEGRPGQSVAKVKTKWIQVQIAWTTEFMVSVKCEISFENSLGVECEARVDQSRRGKTPSKAGRVH